MRVMLGASGQLLLRRADVAVAIVAALLIGGIFIVPALASLGRDASVLSEREALLHHQESLVASAKRLGTTGSDLHRRLAVERARLFHGDSTAATAELADYAGRLADDSGVQLASLEGTPALMTRGVVQVSATVRSEGNWRHTLGYLRALESSPKLIRVSELRLIPVGNGDIELSATVSGYAEVMR
jgi:hypothetical protein